MAHPELTEEERLKIFNDLKAKFDGKVSYTPKSKTVGKTTSNYRGRNKPKDQQDFKKNGLHN